MTALEKEFSNIKRMQTKGEKAEAAFRKDPSTKMEQYTLNGME